MRLGKNLVQLMTLPAEELRLLYTALLMLPVTGVLLRTVGYNRTVKLLSQFRGRSHDSDTLSNTSSIEGMIMAQRVTRMVSVASRHGLYRPGCLRQSLVLWWMLGRRGLSAEIRFGVPKVSSDKFVGHAWVEYQGSSLIAPAAMFRARSNCSEP